MLINGNDLSNVGILAAKNILVLTLIILRLRRKPIEEVKIYWSN